MFSLWGFPEQLAKVHSGHIDPAEAEEIKARREAEKKIEELGIGECSFCKQEIVKNETLGVWESEFLVGYCTEARDHKHKPKIVWKKES